MLLKVEIQSIVPWVVDFVYTSSYYKADSIDDFFSQTQEF